MTIGGRTIPIPALSPRARNRVRGRIVFHTAGDDIELCPGDKMVLPPHTAHAATVGAEGVRCIEAPRQRD